MSTTMLLALLLAATASAPSPPPPRVPDCAGPDYHAIDWWFGKWDVFDTNTGTGIGGSRVNPWYQDPCSVREDRVRYGDTPFYGPEMTMLQYYKTAPNYRQLLVWPDGRSEVLSGNDDGGRIVMVGVDGAERSRWTLMRQPDGTVRLVVERSLDSGATWGSSPIHDFTYRRFRRAP